MNTWRFKLTIVVIIELKFLIFTVNFRPSSMRLWKVYFHINCMITSAGFDFFSYHGDFYSKVNQEHAVVVTRQPLFTQTSYICSMHMTSWISLDLLSKTQNRAHLLCRRTFNILVRYVSLPWWFRHELMNVVFIDSVRV